MPHIPLEDNFDDVINKAQRGLRLADGELARRAGIELVELYPDADWAGTLAGRFRSTWVL